MYSTQLHMYYIYNIYIRYGTSGHRIRYSRVNIFPVIIIIIIVVRILCFDHSRTTCAFHKIFHVFLMYSVYVYLLTVQVVQAALPPYVIMCTGNSMLCNHHSPLHNTQNPSLDSRCTCTHSHSSLLTYPQSPSPPTPHRMSHYSLPHTPPKRTYHLQIFCIKSLTQYFTPPPTLPA